MIQYTSGDGKDTIYGFDSTSMLSISGSSYSTQASGNDLLVKVGTGAIRLKNAYALADTLNINGDVIALERKAIKLTVNNNNIEISRDSISVAGSSERDNISNNGSYVTINGGAGNDSIYSGGYSFNIYEYTAGDGNDTIYNFSENDTLNISGGTHSTTKSGDNLIVKIGKGQITLVDAASLSSVNITNSTPLTVTNKTKSPVTLGAAFKTADASTRTKAIQITGNALDNTIRGGSKNDTIYGGDGNDSILGGAGNDKLYGQAGDDTLRGGAGNDSLWGGDGADKFIYVDGDGNDVIFGFDNSDMLQITGAFSASYSKSKKEVYFKVGSTSKAITLSDFTATSFNVNGIDYKVSGSKLIEK